MSCQFAQVFQQELKAVGLSSLAATALPGTEDLPALPYRRGDAEKIVPPMIGVADRTTFSLRAQHLSFSLQHYARDAGRPGQSDPSLVTGWNEAGYLRDAGQGLHGEMLLSTGSGTLVAISARTNCQGQTDVRVRAVKDGVEHSFSLDDFSECGSICADADAPRPAALPAGEPPRNAKQQKDEQSTLTYSARFSKGQSSAEQWRNTRFPYTGVMSGHNGR